MLAVESPLEAYRSDLERNPGQEDFGPSDTLWLLIAHCLGRVSRAAADSRSDLSSLCAKALREFSAPQSRMGDQLAVNLDQVNYGLANNSSAEGSDSLARGVRGFVSQMCEAGALATAYSTVALARQIVDAGSSREQGLLAADQARIARQLGDFETAEDLYEVAEGIAKRANDDALLSRVSTGRGTLARTRGNYPKARELFERALKLAESSGCADVQFIAHQGLTITCAVANNVNDALRHGWLAFEFAGADMTRQAEALSNLAQLSLLAGYPRAALSGFAAALSRSHSLRIRLPQLGGAALGAGRCKDLNALGRLAAEIERVTELSALPYENAQAFLHLAQAFAAVGDEAQAARYRESTRRIAKTRGFFELMHAIQPEQFAQQVSAVSTPDELSPTSRKVIESLSAMETESDVVALVTGR
jgi:tetratricopeptide (TPR) repeat protein